MRKYVPFSSDPIFTFRSLFMQETQKSPPFTDSISAWERRSNFEPLISSKRFIICVVKFVPTLLRIFGFSFWIAQFSIVTVFNNFNYYCGDISIPSLLIKKFYFPCCCKYIQNILDNYVYTKKRYFSIVYHIR